jgi:uncharacterized protein
MSGGKMFLFDLSAGEMAAMFITLLLAGLLNGSIGLGIPIVSIPIFAPILGLQTSVAMMIVPLLTTNISQIWIYREHRRQAGLMLPFLALAVIGIVAGTNILLRVDERALYAVLGALIMVYIAINVFNPAVTTPERIGYRVAPVVGFLGGMLQGMTGISAPISLVFLHSLRWVRGLFIFAVSIMFLSFGIVQSITLASVGILTWDIMLASALIVIPVLAMMPVGNYVGKRASKRTFELTVLGLLGLLALRLLYLSVAGN